MTTAYINADEEYSSERWLGSEDPGKAEGAEDQSICKCTGAGKGEFISPL